MISNHVTYFILFHWSDIVFFSFLLHLHSSCHWHPRMLSCLCEFVIEVSHGLHWCMLFDFIYGGFVCFLDRWEISPSLSVPSVAVPGVTISTKSINPPRPCPAFSGLTRACLDVLPCAPCSAVQYFSGFNYFCCVQVKTSRRGSSYLGSERWVFLS